MYIGIDVGGTTIKILIFKDNEIIKFDKVSNNTSSKDSVLNSIKNGINKVISTSELDSIEAIGLSIAGQVDYKTGILNNSPNIPLKNFNFSQFFLDNYNKPSFVDNDVNCAAIAESSLYPSFSTQVFIFLGTGIGGAAIVNGKMLRGASNLAMEIGHMSFKEGGLPCGCGRFGCFEAYGGGKKMINRYKTLSNISSDINIIQLEDKYLEGDKIALEVFGDALESLSVLTNNLVTLFDPDYIIFGGGNFDYSKLIVPHIKKYIKNNIRFADFSKINFKSSVFKDRSNAYGAIVGYLRNKQL